MGTMACRSTLVGGDGRRRTVHQRADYDAPEEIEEHMSR